MSPAFSKAKSAVPAKTSNPGLRSLPTQRWTCRRLLETPSLKPQLLQARMIVHPRHPPPQSRPPLFRVTVHWKSHSPFSTSVMATLKKPASCYDKPSRCDSNSVVSSQQTALSAASLPLSLIYLLNVLTQVRTKDYCQSSLKTPHCARPFILCIGHVKMYYTRYEADFESLLESGL
eukprot:m.182381 g.182381  ORF g.182381 m.182381 type:complete len:176 (-) comp10484_c1_seq4:3164-3691(-)